MAEITFTGNYFKLKQIKAPNQKAEISRMEKEKKEKKD